MGVLGLLVHSGGGWVIWLLMLASVLTLAVIVERAIVLRRERRAFDGVRVGLRAALNDGDLRRAADLAGGSTTVAASVLSAGLARPAVGPAAVEERLAAARIDGKYRLERRLWVLGTLGNNAPFRGAFRHGAWASSAPSPTLAGNAGAGPEVVMAGLSEALVATAVGLLVAIPAVMAYNYFLKRAGEYLAETDALSRLLMAALKEKK
jgi:biopolymer transport protein ExbB